MADVAFKFRPDTSVAFTKSPDHRATEIGDGINIQGKEYSQPDVLSSAVWDLKNIALLEPTSSCDDPPAGSQDEWRISVFKVTGNEACGNDECVRYTGRVSAETPDLEGRQRAAQFPCMLYVDSVPSDGLPDEMSGPADLCPFKPLAPPLAPTPSPRPPTPSPPSTCPGEKLPPRPFDASASGHTQGELASAFAVNTTRGAFRLVDVWGCSSVVFLVDIATPTVGNCVRHPIPSASTAETYEQTWPIVADATKRKEMLQDLIEASPNSVHYIFLSTRDGRHALMEEMDAAFEQLAPSEHWQAHVHFALEFPSAIVGAPGDYLCGYNAFCSTTAALSPYAAPLPFAFAIDRKQRFDAGGDIVELYEAARLARTYDRLAELDFAIRAEGATAQEHVLVSGVTTDRYFYVPFTSPPGSQRLDTMHFDITVTCHENNPFRCADPRGMNRPGFIFHCKELLPDNGGDRCGKATEVARWMRPY